jgi:hypothetical protein
MQQCVGGQIIEDENAQGVKTQQHVYTSSGVELASGMAETTMIFKHTDPVTRTEQGSWTNAADSYRTELDPVGGDVGTYQPLEDDPGNDFPMRHGSLSEPANLCAIDGLPSDCQSMMLALQSGGTLFFARGAAPGGGGSRQVLYDDLGHPHLVPRWTPGHEIDVWKWIPYTGEGEGEGAFAPEPTIYSGMQYFEYNHEYSPQNSGAITDAERNSANNLIDKNYDRCRKLLGAQV